MSLAEFQGDFLGFTFNGIHSSEFGIVRTYNSQMQDQILPQMQDITTTITKGQGSMYYGTTYTQKNLSIAFSFTNIEEDSIKRMKILFNDKQIHKLIYDESPYKSYRAKANGVSVIKHLAFSRAGKRYYSGDGTINFICYFPYAISEFSELSAEHKNMSWAAASNIPDANIFGKIQNNTTQIYNAGDGDMLIGMVIDLSSVQEATKVTINMTYKNINGPEGSFSLVNMPTNKTCVYVDFFRASIYGYNIENDKRVEEASYLTYMTGDFMYLDPKQIMYIEFNGYIDDTEITDFSSLISFELQYLYI